MGAYREEQLSKSECCMSKLKVGQMLGKEFRYRSVERDKYHLFEVFLFNINLVFSLLCFFPKLK